MSNVAKRSQAAIRETMEETGHEVELQSLLGIYTYTPPCSLTVRISVSAL